MTANKRNVVIFAVGFGLLSTFCCCSGNPIPGEDVIVVLAFGWMPFLMKVVPEMNVRWLLMANAVVYAGLFIVGCHYFFRWLYREIRTPPASDGTPGFAWRWKWTVSLFIVIVLMFATGLATTGAIQQTGWMLASGKGIYESYYARGRQRWCAENLQDIGKALNIYQADHQGHMPDSLDTLLDCAGKDGTGRYRIYTIHCEAVSQKTSGWSPDLREKALEASYLYFGRTMGPTTDPHAVVITEPIENHWRLGKGINVLYKDGTVEWLEDSDAENLLKSLNLDLANRPESQPTTRP